MSTCSVCRKWKKKAKLDKGEVGTCLQPEGYSIMTYAYDTCEKFKQKASKKRLTRAELDARDQ